MEEDLDKIANGEEEWVPVLKKFYEPFIAEVERKDEKLNKADFTLLEVTEEKCPECGKVLNVKLGKYGRFLSCSGFPDCKYARPIIGAPGTNGAGANGGAGNGAGGQGGEGSAFLIDQSQLGKCPDCKEGDLNLREGRFGRFVACSNYPKCKFTKPYLEKIGMKCPKCSGGAVSGVVSEAQDGTGALATANDLGGEVVVKKGGRFRRVFYGCSRYPDCDFVTNKDPRKFKWDPNEVKGRGKRGGKAKKEKPEDK
jgi:DNA topoisomerase-1